MKTSYVVANLLLILVLIGFYFAHHLEFSEYQLLVRSFFDAALVGALADWFAVTALFRKPLGLPIPHTAIVVKKKNAIASSFGEFLHNNFLSREIVKNKLSTLDLNSILINSLKEKNTRSAGIKFISEIVVPAGRDLLNSQALPKGIQTLCLKSFDSPAFEEVMYRLILKLNDVVSHEQQSIRETVSKKIPWFLPSFIDNKIYKILIDGITEWINQMSKSSKSPGRLALKQQIYDFVQSNKFCEFITQILGSKSAKELLLDVIGKDEIEAALNVFEQKLHSDQDLRKIVSERLMDIALLFTDYFGARFSHFVTTTIMNWKDNEVVDLIESQFGADLQFIRINGTILGGVVGILIYLVSVIIT